MPTWIIHLTDDSTEYRKAQYIHIDETGALVALAFPGTKDAMYVWAYAPGTWKFVEQQ